MCLLPKKSILWLLVGGICIGSLSACAKESGNTLQSKQADETTVVAEETEEPRLFPSIPENMDYKGYEFKILMHPDGGVDWTDWNSRDVDAAEENGDVINDAVFKRNAAIEEKLNVVITGVESKDMNVDIKKSVMAGDHAFDATTQRITSITAMAQEGFLYNLLELPYMDLSKPWYDQNAVEELTILGKLFFVTGDLLIGDNDSTAALVFNKQLLEDLSLEDPYQLVRDNKWTMDQMISMVKSASRDLNGNGGMDLSDQYGFIYQRDTVTSLLHGGNGRIASKTKEDVPQIVFGEERNFSIMEKAFDLMYDDSAYNLHKQEGKQDIYVLQKNMFKENRVLFTWIRMRVVEGLRDMETDFGILPVPKYSSEQENYGHTVNKYTGSSLSVPIHIVDPERTGIILEALSSESKYTLQEAYYDVNLGVKLVRDEGSSEMLDIILNSRIYDNGEIYNYGNIGWDLIFMSMKDNRDLASFYTKHEKAGIKALDKMIETYKDL